MRPEKFRPGFMTIVPSVDTTASFPASAYTECTSGRPQRVVLCAYCRSALENKGDCKRCGAPRAEIVR